MKVSPAIVNLKYAWLSAFNGPISVISQVLTMLHNTEITRYYSVLSVIPCLIPPELFRWSVPLEIPPTVPGNLQGIIPGELIMRYEAAEVNGRCHNDLIMCLVL